MNKEKFLSSFYTSLNPAIKFLNQSFHFFSFFFPLNSHAPTQS